MSVAIVWFRNDLRLRDNAALRAAVDAGLSPLPVYIHAPAEEGRWPPGAASGAWRHRSLVALDAQLRARGSRLHVFAGDSLATLRTIAAARNARAVFWNRRYEPAITERDTSLRRALRATGLHAEGLPGQLLFEPWALETKAGDPFRAFTPFWRAAMARRPLPRLSGAPANLPRFDRLPEESAIDQLGLQPARRWDDPFWAHWTPGELGADAAVDTFIAHALDRYASGRDHPGRPSTSRLSAHLHFGEIVPARIVEALARVGVVDPTHPFLRELGWREFAHHVLHHFPQSSDANFNSRFDDFDWSTTWRRNLRAWQRGRTGVPLVDAGMRELWATGWMHNRVRMIAASYLTKHLRIHWLHGARWFWDTLVDADLAANSMGWQWVAGSGVDAAPYFRVFNPVLQARRFDPEGVYIARWVPELARLPPGLRAAPWDGPETHVAVGRYPARPITGLAAGRKSALAAYKRLRAVRT